MSELKIDLDVMHWPLADQFVYHRAVGVGPVAALSGIAAGNVIDAPPEHLFGFLFVAAHRADPSVTFDGLAAETDMESMLEAFASAFDEDAAPDPTPAATDSPASTTSSPSPSKPAGRKTKSSA